MSNKNRPIITLQTGLGDVGIGAGNIKSEGKVTDIYLSFSVLDSVQKIGDSVLKEPNTTILQVRFDCVESFNVLLRAVEQMKEHISEIS